MTGGPLGLDPGLLARFRAAGGKIAWRAAGRSPAMGSDHRARIAHLNDEEARVESWGHEGQGGVEVDSGPVGALVLLLEADRRGVPGRIEAREAGEDRAFPNGAIRAVWGGRPSPSTPALGVRDLVDLARYALA